MNDITQYDSITYDNFCDVIKVIDSSNLAAEMLYSYDKFIEIFDKHGFSGFVS